MPEIETQDGYSLQKDEKTQTSKTNETIINVSKDIASMSLGFSIDGGNSVTKLLYRSKKDYELGKPEDVNNPFGKLRLTYFDHDAVDEMIEFLKNNCDIIPDANNQGNNGGEGDSDKRTVWYQIGMTYTNWKNQLEENLNIRTTVLSESLAFLSAIPGFYMKSSTYDINLQHHILPLSEAAVSKGRDTCVTNVKTCDHFRAIGEVAIGAMTNRPRDGFDLVKYKADLISKSPAELASELQLVDIQYPLLLIGLGSLAQIYLINEDGSCNMLDFITTSTRTFYNISRTLTGAKDFDELAGMVGRGKPHMVDEHSSDISNARTDWFTALPDGLMLNSAGKLGQAKYKGSYTADDIAASLALSFCTSTCKTVILYARLHNIKSVLFSGTYLSQDATRAYLDQAFAAVSLFLPFEGGDIMKMGVLSNPGHTCALGAWRINWELEQAQKKL